MHFLQKALQIKKKKQQEKRPRYGLRKLSMGLVSCMLGFVLVISSPQAVLAAPEEERPVAMEEEEQKDPVTAAAPEALPEKESAPDTDPEEETETPAPEKTDPEAEQDQAQDANPEEGQVDTEETPDGEPEKETETDPDTSPDQDSDQAGEKEEEPKQKDQFDPKFSAIKVAVDGTVTEEALTAALATDSVPAGTTVSTISDLPALKTTTAGSFYLPVTVTYPDGSVDNAYILIKVVYNVNEDDGDLPSFNLISTKYNKAPTLEDIKNAMVLEEGEEPYIDDITVDGALPDGKKSGTFAINISFTLEKDTWTAGVLIVVEPSDAETYEPTGDSITKEYGTETTAEEIKKQVSVPNYPEDGGTPAITIDEGQDLPDGNTPGNHKVQVTVTYPDTSMDHIEVSVTVNDKKGDGGDDGTTPGGGNTTDPGTNPGGGNTTNPGDGNPTTPGGGNTTDPDTNPGGGNTANPGGSTTTNPDSSQPEKPHQPNQPGAGQHTGATPDESNKPGEPNLPEGGQAGAGNAGNEQNPSEADKPQSDQPTTNTPNANQAGNGAMPGPGNSNQQAETDTKTPELSTPQMDQDAEKKDKPARDKAPKTGDPGHVLGYASLALATASLVAAISRKERKQEEAE